MMRVVMENAGLSFWPVLSLVVFFLLTLGVLFWIFRPGSSEFYRKLGRKPLENGSARPRAGDKKDDDGSSNPKPSPEE